MALYHTHHTTTHHCCGGLFSCRRPVVHKKRHVTMGDKISSAFLKLNGAGQARRSVNTRLPFAHAVR